MDALFGISQLDLDTGRHAEARARLERAYQIDPEPSELHHALAQVYLIVGENDLARQFAASAANAPPRRTIHDPRRERALPQAGSLQRTLSGHDLEQQGSFAEALVQYELALENNKDKADSHLNVARMMARLSDGEGAIEHYREALRINPTEFNALVQLADLLERSGDTPTAVALYQRALAEQPDNARVLYRLGTALAGSGGLAEGLAMLERSIEADPASAKALLNLGIILAQT